MPKTLTLRAQILLVLVPALIYLGLFLARPWWFHPWCSVQPTPCTLDSLSALERYSFSYRSVMADFISNLIQNGLGLFAFIFPWVFISERTPETAFRLNLALLAGTAWNGVMLELVRGIIQRPRPLVYLNPMAEGTNIDQYTSFYSGHTSFVALALFFLVMISSTYNIKPFWTRGRLTLLYLLGTALMASLRVIGGRHFLTDTLAGAAFGTLGAYLIHKVIIRRN